MLYIIYYICYYLSKLKRKEMIKMRDDAKIERYKKMRDDSRERFMRTGSKEHLEDMFTLKQMIESEMNKESRKLGWVLFGITAVTLASPLIIWLLK